jgi:hypothetical protein
MNPWVKVKGDASDILAVPSSDEIARDVRLLLRAVSSGKDSRYAEARTPK